MVMYLLPAAFFGSFVITSALHRSLPWKNAWGGVVCSRLVIEIWCMRGNWNVDYINQMCEMDP
eukprot:scaffold371364_cov76-Cyclotella_meneghiniana.AAC.2